MKILVINSGSSSIKAAVFEQTEAKRRLNNNVVADHNHLKKDLKELAKVTIDGIGLKRCKLSFKSENKNMGLPISVKNHEAGVKIITDHLLKNGIIKKLLEIETVGHRVVHGGEKYSNSIKIDSKIIKDLEALSPLAPLHNPANIESIKACKKLLPKAKQVAVFDTAFHQTIPPHAYLYGLPYKLYEDHKIRRYGFHGTSHKFVVEQTIKALKTKKAKIISCHIGNGISITASVNGKSVDTSMGFTPLEGVMMGTRCGSIDPAIILHLQENMKMKPAQINTMLNNQSGLLGISETSRDMRDIYAKALKQDKKALLAIEMLNYQIAKYCGAFAAAMQGIEALTFTGGIGENAFYVREKICDYLNFLGLKIDKKKNTEASSVKIAADKKPYAEISEKKSKVKVFVIPTNEEKLIALESTKA
ncbi:MAG: acetate kinase [Patescibacteria group bacterium]